MCVQHDHMQLCVPSCYCGTSGCLVPYRHALPIFVCCISLYHLLTCFNSTFLLALIAFVHRYKEYYLHECLCQLDLKKKKKKEKHLVAWSIFEDVQDQKHIIIYFVWPYLGKGNVYMFRSFYGFAQSIKCAAHSKNV